jgi:alpha-mannosidase
MVYDNAEKLYAEVRQDGESLLEEAFEALFQKSVPLSSDATLKASDVPGDLVAFNTTFFPRRDVVKIPLRGAASQLKSKVVQTSVDGNVGYALMDNSGGGSLATPIGLYADCMPVSGMFSLLFRPLCLLIAHAFLVHSNGPDHFVLKNSSVQLTISSGRITSLLDVKLK